MIIDSYYTFVKSEGKSKTRYDVEASTKDYEPFEGLINPKEELFMYFCDLPVHFKGEARRRADKCLTAKGRNVSSIYIRDLENLSGYGDVMGTTDGFIIAFSRDQQRFEVFIAKGKKNHVNALYNAFTDGELNSEMEALRWRAINRL
jgi:hypothetical protein